MDCSFSNPLTDDELIAALDNEAEARVMEHLAACPFCTGGLEEMRHVEQLLDGQLHPSPDQLGDYHLGLLDEPKQRVMAAHLKQCPFCRADYESLKAFVSTADLNAEVAAPKQPLIPTRRPMIYHLKPQAGQMSLRGAARQVSHGDGRLMINLDIRSIEMNKVTVQGRLIAIDQAEWAGALLTLRQGGEVRGTTILNDKGSFTLEADAKSDELFALRIDSPTNGTIALDDL